ncbi:hypothetical protein [Streptacidiphilus neutrinimicus]|uniref:hypothetical protein n=1 Tax=Streptacidiphilus neutrinimicus TaxID=105420 RepID=UPI0005AB920F|nr:hypothetical protein [Streptacidiphilus neutrinimicus]
MGDDLSVVHGHCIGCGGSRKLGRLVNEVDTNSGAGWTNVQCAECEENGRGLPPAGPWSPRRYQL